MTVPSAQELSLELKALGLGLRILREAANLTQEEAVMTARSSYPAMSFTVSTLSNWERGKLGNLGSIWALIRSLGSTPQDWLEATEQARRRLEESAPAHPEMTLDDWAQQYEAKLASSQEARSALERLKELTGEGPRVRRARD